jgi:lysophospholipase L1-like esterase
LLYGFTGIFLGLSYMAHIVLLGDSIFDNKSYVGYGGKDVVTHLRDILPDGWQATLKAIDGSVIEGVSRQLGGTNDATHFVISVGGNDAIMNADILEMRAGSAAEVFNELANRKSFFERQYSDMLQTVLSKNVSTAVCTIYYPNFPDALMQKLAITALASFNDVIIRQAILNKLPLLDLRLICNEASDYANPIEPSDTGGRKIARKILELVSNHDFSNSKTTVYF